MRTSSLLASAQALLRDRRLGWVHDSQLWVELFAASNLAVLAADICIAHSLNHFRRLAEFIPLIFSVAAPIVLAIGMYLRWVRSRQNFWRVGGLVTGWLAIVTGLAGVLYHLESSFFMERTLRSLTYSAPFAAPLAYTGLGFLLLVNRMVAVRSRDWARWILFLALGGFFGNFVLSLTDHAGNGFFARTEWIPVCSSALATGFLLVPLVVAVSRRFMDACSVVLLLQAAVGVLGFWFHLEANLAAPGASLWDKMVNGAPPMAPLLFPNLVALAAIGMWAFMPHLPEPDGRASWLGAFYRWAHPGLTE
jgi:hypothetical protein